MIAGGDGTADRMKVDSQSDFSTTAISGIEILEVNGPARVKLTGSQIAGMGLTTVISGNGTTGSL